MKPLGGVSETAAKGHAIALSLSGTQSLATVVYQLPRQDLSQHIWVVLVAKKYLWKPMRRLLSGKGPLTCNPRHIQSTLLYRKAVGNKNYEHVDIPKPQDMDRITSNLNKQLQDLLKDAFCSDSMIADRLLQQQRAEVEDDVEGLNNIGCDEIFLKGIMLTAVPSVANPMLHVMESLSNNMDDPNSCLVVTASQII